MNTLMHTEYNSLIEYLLSGGVEKYTLLFIISLPVIYTIINISKYIVGLKISSIYSIIATVFLYYSIGFALSSSDGNNFGNGVNIAEGIKYGSLIIFILLAVITLSYFGIKKLHMHYSPKITLVMIFISISFIAIVITGKVLQIPYLYKLAPISIVLLSIIAEEILSNYIISKLVTTISITIQTIIVSGLCFILISMQLFQDFMLNYPWIILIMLLINFAVGKYTGLRLTEYFRFYDLLIDDDYENTSDSEE